LFICILIFLDKGGTLLYCTTDFLYSLNIAASLNDGVLALDSMAAIIFSFVGCFTQIAIHCHSSPCSYTFLNHGVCFIAVFVYKLIMAGPSNPEQPVSSAALQRGILVVV
jgi:hypothetical protein